MQRERLELNTRQSLIAISLALVIIYLAASWAIDSGKILPHIIAYLAAYYAVYFTFELFKKRLKSDDKTSTARRAKKTNRNR